MDSDVVVNQKREAWFIPIAILSAGVILATTIYIQRSNDLPGTIEGDISLLRPVTEADHIIGNPSAPVVLVEYADIDSTYAKSFQATLEQLMSEYAQGGQVAWVYRHLPLIDQHAYAASHAEAAECAASIGGPTTFWRFISALNTASPGEQQFNPADYQSVIESLGLLPQSFSACMQAHTFQERVASDFANGIALGAGGSPFSVLLVRNQPPVAIDGAVPYEGMKQILDTAIMESSEDTQ